MKNPKNLIKNVRALFRKKNIRKEFVSYARQAILELVFFYLLLTIGLLSLFGSAILGMFYQIFPAVTSWALIIMTVIYFFLMLIYLQRNYERDDAEIRLQKIMTDIEIVEKATASNFAIDLEQRVANLENALETTRHE